MGSRVWLKKKPESILDWLLIVFACIAFYLAMGHLNIFWGGIVKILAVISPFAGAAVLAYILDPFARWFTKYVLKGQNRFRWLSILFAYVAMFALLAALVMLVVPQVISSITMLFENLPVYVDNIQAMLNTVQTSTGVDLNRAIAVLDDYQEMMTSVSTAITGMVPQIVAYAQNAVSNVVSWFTALAGSIYMLAEKEKLLRQLRTASHAFLPKSVAENVLRICHNANENFSSFFTGKIIDSLIVGVACFIMMSILRMNFAPLISVVIGITNIIPVFGPFIGAVPSLIILLIVNPIQALEFLILIIVLQQVDGNFLGPKILGHSIGISALWVLFAIVVGGDLFGVVGMLLGVPVFATLYGVVKEFVDWCLKTRGIDSNGVQLAPPDGHFVAYHVRDDQTAAEAEAEALEAERLQTDAASPMAENQASDAD